MFEEETEETRTSKIRYIYRGSPLFGTRSKKLYYEKEQPDILYILSFVIKLQRRLTVSHSSHLFLCFSQY